MTESLEIKCNTREIQFRDPRTSKRHTYSIPVEHLKKSSMLEVIATFDDPIIELQDIPNETCHLLFEFAATNTLNLVD